MDGPIDPACGCYTCKTFSIAYLFHLNRVRETLGWQLLGMHNIHFYMQLMRRMREHILAGTWLCFYRSQREVLDARDRYGPVSTHITKAQRAMLKMQLGRYEVTVRDDIGHIRDRISGEVMHPVSDPSQEARLLYVEQPRLIERLKAADKEVELFTYSYSTSVRAAMLAAGFYVAKGVGTGPKAETTIALSPRAAALPHERELLGREWLGKWRRSDAQLPFGVPPGEERWREAVSGHPQFQ
jgi:Queuine tRNA-ribosyltransferase/S-adenosyl-L-methionine-dependent methyltransferase